MGERLQAIGAAYLAHAEAEQDYLEAKYLLERANATRKATRVALEEATSFVRDSWTNEEILAQAG